MKSDNLDKDIWQGLVDNDRKYQELLYRRYYSYGMSICLRYSSSREEAKEILHDGFMILFKTPRKFNPSLPFKPWFRRVLINRCINHFKKHLKIRDETGIDQIPESENKEPSPLENMQYEELVQLILRLPTAYRAVFNLYVLDGYPHDEIARLLDISVGTSKSNLSRARQKLRELLNSQSNEREFLRQER